jgi:membrane fusion protein, heavy metal efflux system
MMARNVSVLALACFLGGWSPACRSSGEGSHDHGHRDHGEHAAEEPARGPHRGRMLRDGDFAVELAIYETGVPPEYRAWCSAGGKPIDPDACKLEVELERFGKRVDVIRFESRGDYLLGDQTVEEPHSFVVTVRAEAEGKAHEWRFESFEGRTTISAENAKASGVEIEAAGPAVIRERVRVVGNVVPNAEALARIVPRYPGVVREARKRIGDAVAKNELLAIVEASQTLQAYEVRSPTAGTVLSRHASPGEVTGEGPIYTVGDLSTVWVDLLLKPFDADRVRRGQPVELATGQGAEARSTIDYVAPTVSSEGQAVVARVILDNADASWRPGLFVTADIVVEETEVAVAVESSALQTFRDGDVVFLNEGDVYQAMPVELGRREGDRVEVTEGIEAGQRYAAKGSFLIKADIEKSGATHDH